MDSTRVWFDAVRFATAIVRSRRRAYLGGSTGKRFTAILLERYSRALVANAVLSGPCFR